MAKIRINSTAVAKHTLSGNISKIENLTFVNTVDREVFAVDCICDADVKNLFCEIISLRCLFEMFDFIKGFDNLLD
jgi:hypothetical protein